MSKQYRRCWTYPDEKGNVKVERSEGIPQFIKDIAEHIEWIEIDAIAAAEKTIAEKDARIKELEFAKQELEVELYRVGDEYKGLKSMSEFLDKQYYKQRSELQEIKTANSQLEQQLKESESVIEYYANEPYIFDESDSDTDQDPQKSWRHYSGKRARVYLAKKAAT